MTFYLVGLGCARNQVDSEVILGRLNQRGWILTRNPEEAHVIIVNTCSFIEPATNESIDTILALARHKKNGACRRLIVVGCLPERYRENIVPALPEVDFFLGTGAFDQIESVMAESGPSGGCLLPNPGARELENSHTPRVTTDASMAYIKIAEGCSSRCTYCIIPKLRGDHRSRPSADIVSEAKQLVARGISEIVLVAQDTTRYGRDLSPKTSLSSLLVDLAEISGDIWIRFLYGHPEHFDSSLLQAMVDHSNLCPYFDFPIQHASNRLLKRMGRRYDANDLHRLFDKIRERMPHAAIRTSVIVGFPGETEDDFHELLSFIEKVRFDHLGAFIYSDSDDLPSHGFSDPVPKTIARKRMNKIMSIQKKISGDRNRIYRNETLPVLVEQQMEPHLFGARTIFQAPEVDGMTFVHTRPGGPGVTVGKFARVKVIDTLEYDLVAEE